MDLIFITSSHAYPALLANPEVHLLGFDELTPHEQERVKKFTKEKWEKVMQQDLVMSEQELIANAEKVILQDLADAKAKKLPNNENRATQTNKHPVGDRKKIPRNPPSEVKSGSIKGN